MSFFRGVCLLIKVYSFPSRTNFYARIDRAINFLAKSKSSKIFFLSAISSNFIHVFEACRALLHSLVRTTSNIFVIVNENERRHLASFACAQQGSARFEDVNEI